MTSASPRQRDREPNEGCQDAGGFLILIARDIPSEDVSEYTGQGPRCQDGAEKVRWQGAWGRGSSWTPLGTGASSRAVSWELADGNGPASQSRATRQLGGRRPGPPAGIEASKHVLPTKEPLLICAR